MRVALITDGIFPYVLGGMQKHSYYLCKYLAQQQVYVELFHFNQSHYDISKLEFFSEDEKKFITSTIVDFPKSFPFPGHYLYNSYRHSKLIFNALEKKLHTYDFIYTKGFTGWYLIEQKFKGKINCSPIGVKFHGYEMFQKPPSFKIKLQHIFLLRQPVKNISLKADVVFSYGGKITDIIRALGVKEEKIFELPSGVENSTLVKNIIPVSDKLKFLFLGRYERRKGIEELNVALKNIETQHSNFECHFIGPIPEDKRLHKANIFYHGEIRDKQKLQTLIRECDILVCPSWSEGMPNVILEAMANGLAVIATDTGATNVLINAHTGWLLSQSNPEEIANAIQTVLNTNQTIINDKKQNALQHITQNFVWEKLIVRFKERFLL
ncbi:MAG: glycosyltransferase family 4 protein [Bacteroidetes bacterium]|nr:glycosyltransferase family 4 protein [Bacteroidota bacterium]